MGEHDTQFLAFSFFFNAMVLIKPPYVDPLRLPRIWKSVLFASSPGLCVEGVCFCETEGKDENESMRRSWAQTLQTKDVFQWEMAHQYLGPRLWQEAAALWPHGYVRPMLRVAALMQKSLARRSDDKIIHSAVIFKDLR